MVADSRTTAPGAVYSVKQRRPSGYPRPYFDIEEIKDLLTVPDVLDLAKVPLTQEDRARRSTCCPIHGGTKPTSFTWYDGGRRYHCFTGCGDGGDVIDLITKLRNTDIGTAIAVAARVVGLGPGTQPDPVALARRRAEAAARSAERSRMKILRDDPRIAAATDDWYGLRKAHQRNVAKGRAYLESRSIDRLVDEFEADGGCRQFRYLYFRPDGSPCTPIYSFEFIGEYDSNAIINLAWRQVAGEPKVLVKKGHTTVGTFGRSISMLDDNYQRVILVEGVIDYLTAVLLFEFNAPALPVGFGGHNFVLGGHSVHSLPKIVRGMAEHEHLGARFRSLPLVLVPHDDGPDGAGAKVHAELLDLCRGYGMAAVTTFDLEGQCDLNAWYCKKAGA